MARYKIGDKVTTDDGINCIVTGLKKNGYNIRSEDGVKLLVLGIHLKPNNDPINICEVLKGHEGEKFYCSAYGYHTVILVNNDRVDFEKFSCDKFGRFHEDGECMIFPSKYQRDWNKWIEENKPKIPKTWSDTLFNSNFTLYELSYIDNNKNDVLTSTGKSPVEKSALALLKIHQLIEAGYGGNITLDEWNNDSTKYLITPLGGPNSSVEFSITRTFYFMDKCHIAFHTEEQAKEFLKYPENIQLLKDYFMMSN